MDVNGEETQPLWPQLTTSSMPRRRNNHRSSSAFLFSPPLLIIILTVTALLILFIAIPSFLSISSQIVRPSTVKKSWDSLIVVMVLFAVFCGLFAKGNEDGASNDVDNRGNSGVNLRRDAGEYKTDSGSQQWFEYSGGDDHRNKIYDSGLNRRPGTGMSRLKRNSSSYPDLRQESLWETGEESFRFFDDFELGKYRSAPEPSFTTSLNQNVQPDQPRRRRSEIEVSETKVIPVDTCVLRPSPLPQPASPASPPPLPASSAPPPPPPPLPTAVHQKSRRTYQSLGNDKVKGEKTKTEMESTRQAQQQPPPPPPPPPLHSTVRLEQKTAKIERRKSNATKEIKMVLASLYNQRKRKKKQTNARNSSDDQNHQYYHHHLHHHLQSSVTESQPYTYSTLPPPSPPPPPPPLPPPPSVFYSLFKKGNKSKKVHSVSNPPKPPPLPPSRSKPSSSNKHIHLAHPPQPPPNPNRRPPLPTKQSSYHEDAINSGNQSPLIPIPPPPPPFKIADLKFAVRGDYAKIRSNQSSRCSSPEITAVDELSKKLESETVTMMDGEDGMGGCTSGSVYCPSPDVNVKADTFIARLRDGWKLEKANSVREKRKRGQSG